MNFSPSRTLLSAIALVALVTTAHPASCSQYSVADISIVTSENLCIANGDYTSLFKRRQNVDILRFDIPFAKGRVETVTEAYMTVRVTDISSDYFIKDATTIRSVPVEPPVTLAKSITIDTPSLGLGYNPIRKPEATKVKVIDPDYKPSGDDRSASATTESGNSEKSAETSDRRNNYRREQHGGIKIVDNWADTNDTSSATDSQKDTGKDKKVLRPKTEKAESANNLSTSVSKRRRDAEKSLAEAEKK